MLVPVLLFLLGFLLLIKGGDWFVDGAVALARRFRLPELLIGATVVSIGTTLPEVMVSSQAAILGNSGISYGNAIGSVICNTSLIAAITIAIRPGKANPKTLRFPVAAFFVAAALYAVFAYTRGYFARWNGVLFLLLFVVYMVVTVVQMKKHSEDAEQEEDEVGAGDMSLGKTLVLLIVGAAAIAWGANLLVNNGTRIAQWLGVPDSVIGLTMVALGTSLPELVTAVTSLIKGHSALSLGNIIGANVFNIVLVSGMAITIRPFAVPVEKTLAGINASFLVDLPVMFLVMALLCLPSLRTGALKRWQGVTLLVIYAGFIVFQYFT